MPILSGKPRVTETTVTFTPRVTLTKPVAATQQVAKAKYERPKLNPEFANSRKYKHYPFGVWNEKPEENTKGMLNGELLDYRYVQPTKTQLAQLELIKVDFELLLAKVPNAEVGIEQWDGKDTLGITILADLRPHQELCAEVKARGCWWDYYLGVWRCHAFGKKFAMTKAQVAKKRSYR